MRGYYSLIQYCPEPTKAEVANVGVVLLCPEARFLGVEVANGNDRVRRIFGVQGEGLERVDSMKRSLRERLIHDRERLGTLEALQHFISTRGNKLQMTEPRNMRVENASEDLRRLFKELVGGRAYGEAVRRAERGLSLRRELREVLSRPELEGKVAHDVPVQLRHGVHFKAAYAFYNGKNSYIKPQTIHVDRDQTLREAELLAFRGNQLYQQGIGDRQAELIVPVPAPMHRLADVTRDVIGLLKDNNVRTVVGGELEGLAEEIEREANLIRA